MKTIYQFGDFVLKIGKNSEGTWGVFKGSGGKANILVYHRFFKTKEVAERWAIRWLKKRKIIT